MALGDIDLRFAAGVALGDIDLHFVWKAWRLATSTCILRGRRGTYGTGLALVAHLVHVWHRCRCSCFCGRRDIWRHRPSFSVAGMALGDIDLRFAAGVALGDIDLHFVWKAWRLATSTCILRGRRGTYGTGLALVARLVPV